LDDRSLVREVRQSLTLIAITAVTLVAAIALGLAASLAG
jgi:hypothetical protein